VRPPPVQWAHSQRVADEAEEEAAPLRLVKRSIDEYLERRRQRRLEESSAGGDTPAAVSGGPRGGQRQQQRHAWELDDYDNGASSGDDDGFLPRAASAVGQEVEALLRADDAARSPDAAHRRRNAATQRSNVDHVVGLDVAYAALKRRRECRVLAAALDEWSWYVRWGNASADAHW
jgi:hypothetical protein